MIEQAPYRDAVNSEQGLMSTSWTRWLEKVGLYVGTLSDAGTANPTTNLWVGRMFYRRVGLEEKIIISPLYG